MFCKCFRYSAGFQTRMVLKSDAFRPCVLREIGDVLEVLGVDRVVLSVVRVLKSWWKQEWMRKKMCSRCTAGERTTKMRHVLIRWQTLFRRTKIICNSWAKRVMCVPHFSTDCNALYVQCFMGVLSAIHVDFLTFLPGDRNHYHSSDDESSHEPQLICHCEVVRCEVEDEDAVSDNFLLLRYRFRIWMSGPRFRMSRCEGFHDCIDHHQVVVTEVLDRRGHALEIKFDVSKNVMFFNFDIVADNPEVVTHPFWLDWSHVILDTRFFTIVERLNQDLGRGDWGSSEIVSKVVIFERELMCGDNFFCEIWETLIFLFFQRLVQWLDLPFDPERSECHQRFETSRISGSSWQHTQESEWIARGSISQFMN